MALPDEFYSFPDPSGNIVEFNPRTGELRDAPNQPNQAQPSENEREDDSQLPATYTTVSNIFFRCLGRYPLSPQEAEGYGRFDITNAEAEREICSSPEAVRWRNRDAFPIVPPATSEPPRNAPPPATPSGPSEVSLDLLTQIAKNIRDAITGVGKSKDELQKEIDKKIAAVAPTVGRATEDIQRQLDQIIAGTIPNVLTTVGSALGGVQNLLGGFLKAAATVADVAGAFKDMVSGSKDAALGFFTATAVKAGDTLQREGGAYVDDAVNSALATIAERARRTEQP